MKPLVAIVGRPNVGKSTLFNRISGLRRAIVQDTPGVTRDRHYAEADWAGSSFLLVDTGGFELDTGDVLREGMRRQAELAIQEAAAVIFVVDGMEGLCASDEEIAMALRRSGRPAVIAANKLDSTGRERSTGILSELASLGFDTFPISAEHGRGIGDLLDGMLEALGDKAVRSFSEEDDEEGLEEEAHAVEEGVIRLAVIGRPNVGKSTLLNALLGKERFLATEVAGTTRDSLDEVLRFQGQNFVLTDTAGVRRRSNVSAGLERLSILRSLKSVEASNVAVLVMDAMEPAVSQDARLAKLCVDRGRSIVLVVNKWDLAYAKGVDPETLRKQVWEALPEVSHAPIVLSSALEGRRVFSVLEAVMAVHERQSRRIPTPELNNWIDHIGTHRPAPLASGHPNKMIYMAQTGVCPPRFAIQCSRPDEVPESYRRFLVNQLRELRDFSGVPLQLKLRARGGRS